MTTTPPGWYDDGNGARRWWDGANWTQHVAAPAAPAAPAADQATFPPAPADHAAVPLAPTDQATLPLVPIDPSTAPTVPLAPFDQGTYGTASPYVPATVATAYPQSPGGGPAPAEPPKSRMWILWVAIGAVVLIMVVTLAILTPLLWAALTSAGSPSAVESPTAAPTTEASSAAPTSAPPTAADEVAAGETVQRHNEAWLLGDCDGFMATTTEELRENLEMTTCETFAVESRYFAAGVDDYVTTIDEIEVVGVMITVSTSESFMSPYDNEGNQTDEPQAYVDRYEYFLERSGDDWVINDYFTR